MPVTVVRPSIVVGERDSGWTPSFNVIYWPLRAFSRGAYGSSLPAPRRPWTSSRSTMSPTPPSPSAQAPHAVGATFHLSAGRSVSSVGELLELATSFFGRPAPRLLEPEVYRRVVHPVLVRASRDERLRRALRRSEMFFPYFDARVQYDDRRTRALLHDSGIAPTPLYEYFDRLIEFAIAAEWGKRQLPRAGLTLGRPPAHRRLPEEGPERWLRPSSQRPLFA